MEFLGLLLVALLAIFEAVQGAGGGWSSAHATFYGGGDASGTMGKPKAHQIVSTMDWTTTGLSLLIDLICCWYVLQEELVGMGICTARGMGLTQRRWARLCSTTGWAAGLAMRSNVWTICSGVSLDPLLSLAPTSAHQTMLFRTMQGGGAIPHSSTLISLSLSFNRLPSSGLGLSLFSSEGKKNNILFSVSKFLHRKFKSLWLLTQ